MPEPSEHPIRLLVADDHPVIRAGIVAVITRQPDMVLVAEASDGVEAVALFDRHRPDVTLMDLQMPRMNGVDAIAEIRSRAPSARILVLTTYRGDVQAMRALKAGAAGYLLKDTHYKDFVAAIRKVNAGAEHIAPAITRELSMRVPPDLLSPREMDVLREVATGSANKQVASRLGVSDQTVKVHMKSVLAKLGASSRLQAVMTALQRGILDRER